MFDNLPTLARTFPYWIIGVILGTALIVASAWRAVKGLRASHWPCVDGKVISTKLIEQKETTEDDKGRQSESFEYKLEVNYSYTVGGVPYTGNRVAFSYLWSRSKDRDQALQKKLDSAKSVRVYYNVQNPKDSTLVAGFDRLILFYAFFGLLCFGAARCFWLIMHAINSGLFDYAGKIKTF